MKKRKTNCVFCRNDFPLDYQLVSETQYWFFVLNIKPQCNFHCLIVLKAEIIDRKGHISDLGDKRLPDEAMRELGILLKSASIAIKKSDPTIKKILVASLNTGEKSQHLHFHLIPKRVRESIKTVNNPKKDGGGMFFLARKEMVVDTFTDFLKSITGNESSNLIESMEKATKTNVQRNAQILKKNFEKLWKSDNKTIRRKR
jgi:diadenosine tetraphosphate (Ap4A) HIT family hydrolase